jgi:VanZ family protein
MNNAAPQFSFTRYQLPAFLWAVVIFISSSIPSTMMPTLKIFDYDKLIHCGIYFLLAFFTYRALRYQTRFPSLARRALLWTVLLIMVYGASDEFHQYFVPGRQADVFDLMADTTGACVLVVGVWVRRVVSPGVH